MQLDTVSRDCQFFEEFSLVIISIRFTSIWYSNEWQVYFAYYFFLFFLQRISFYKRKSLINNKYSWILRPLHGIVCSLWKNDEICLCSNTRKCREEAKGWNLACAVVIIRFGKERSWKTKARRVHCTLLTWAARAHDRKRSRAIYTAHAQKWREIINPIGYPRQSAQSALDASR